MLMILLLLKKSLHFNKCVKEENFTKDIIKDLEKYVIKMILKIHSVIKESIVIIIITDNSWVILNSNVTIINILKTSNLSQDFLFHKNSIVILHFYHKINSQPTLTTKYIYIVSTKGRINVKDIKCAITIIIIIIIADN